MYDLPVIRLHRSGEDLHQRRFAGAVVSDQADDLARAHAEIDNLQGSNCAEQLCDVPEFDQRLESLMSGLFCHYGAVGSLLVIRLRSNEPVSSRLFRLEIGLVH